MGRPRKLSDEDVAEIRRLSALRESLSSRRLAERYGVSVSVVQWIARGRLYKRAWTGPA